MTWTNYPYIWADWGNGAPFDGWAGDEWSLRFWRDVYFPGGDYQFGIRSDDGARIMLDNESSDNPTMNCWYEGCDDSRVRYVSSGWHRVTIDYYENQGGARLFAFWYGPGYPRPDVQPPSGRISMPSDLSVTNQSPLSIAAEASDDASGVDRVEFVVWYCTDGGSGCDWRRIGTDYTAPYSIEWDWSGVPEQLAYLAVDIFDRTGKVTGAAGGWTRVALDKTDPQAWFVQPSDGTYLIQPQITLNVDTSDSNGVASAQFFAGYPDGTSDYWHELGWDRNDSDSHFGLVWDSSTVPRNTNLGFFVWTYDKAGNHGAASASNIVVVSPDKQIRLLDSETWSETYQPRVTFASGVNSFLVATIDNISGATQQVDMSYILLWSDGPSEEYHSTASVDPGTWYVMISFIMPPRNGIHTLRVESLFMGNLSMASSSFFIYGAPEPTATPTQTPIPATSTPTPTGTPVRPTPTPTRTPTPPGNSLDFKIYVPLVTKGIAARSDSVFQGSTNDEELSVSTRMSVSQVVPLVMPMTQSGVNQYPETQPSLRSGSVPREYPVARTPEVRIVPEIVTPQPTGTPSYELWKAQSD